MCDAATVWSGKSFGLTAVVSSQPPASRWPVLGKHIDYSSIFPLVLDSVQADPTRKPYTFNLLPLLILYFADP